MLVIDPNLCIDCGLCESACPAQAITHDLNSELKWIEHNAKYSQIWPAINEMIEPLPNASENMSNNDKSKFDPGASE